MGLWRADERGQYSQVTRLATFLGDWAKWIMNWPESQGLSPQGPQPGRPILFWNGDNDGYTFRFTERSPGSADRQITLALCSVDSWLWLTVGPTTTYSMAVKLWRP